MAMTSPASPPPTEIWPDTSFVWPETPPDTSAECTYDFGPLTAEQFEFLCQMRNEGLLDPAGSPSLAPASTIPCGTVQRVQQQVLDGSEHNDTPGQGGRGHAHSGAHQYRTETQGAPATQARTEQTEQNPSAAQAPLQPQRPGTSSDLFLPVFGSTNAPYRGLRPAFDGPVVFIFDVKLS
ncbi:hypothetical protein AURDEDRAFT_131973 [Auricularia subglabra TFB-10046 SS5]|uniref:Uncharacterized protein n=1 Tax=Auricularia subglabra (strain TFB-10046 / SS5) TaxID=717982 RepID=J0WM20_AURST|nr:hypothetical protein AURDEDRAFT_131973 [Auricularia subglabra TFB-10046 SS5]